MPSEAHRVGRPTRLTGSLRKLAEELGTVEALAEAVGVDRRTLLRWSRGERQPGGPARRILAELAKRCGIPPPVYPKPCVTKKMS
jgi:transcriptional regulator with XRE-family HTH domain